MATIAPQLPNLISQPGVEPGIAYWPVLQGGTFTVGDVVVVGTTGTIVTPAAAATITSAPLWSGSTTPAFTLTSSAGAPATTYWVYVQLTASGPLQGPLSPEITIFAPAGFVPTITSPDAATNATNYQVFATNQGPGYEAAQVASIGTALGSTTALANPLTNNTGAKRGATNQAGSGVIIGIAAVNYNANYYSGTQSSVRDTFGNTYNTGVNSTNEQLNSQIISGFNAAGGLQIFEMSLATQYFPALNNTTAGLLIDTTTNIFTVDPSQSNKVVTILGPVDGPSGYFGDGTLTSGKRVFISFVSSALAALNTP